MLQTLAKTPQNRKMSIASQRNQYREMTLPNFVSYSPNRISDDSDDEISNRREENYMNSSTESDYIENRKNVSSQPAAKKSHHGESIRYKNSHFEERSRSSIQSKGSRKTRTSSSSDEEGSHRSRPQPNRELEINRVEQELLEIRERRETLLKKQEMNAKERELELRMKKLEEREKAVREAEKRESQRKTKEMAPIQNLWMRDNCEAAMEDGDANDSIMETIIQDATEVQPRSNVGKKVRANAVKEEGVVRRQSPRFAGQNAKKPVGPSKLAAGATPKRPAVEKKKAVRAKKETTPQPPPKKRLIWPKRDVDKLKLTIRTKKPTGSAEDWEMVAKLLAKTNATGEDCRQFAISRLKWKEPTLAEETPEKTADSAELREGMIRSPETLNTTADTNDDSILRDMCPGDISADLSLLSGVDSPLLQAAQVEKKKGGRRKSFIPQPTVESPMESRDNNTSSIVERDHNRTARYVHQLVSKTFVSRGNSSKNQTLNNSLANCSTTSAAKLKTARQRPTRFTPVEENDENEEDEENESFLSN
ncbi:unnamed protein product [Caenorhabditis auriculariae]|uniref:Kinetochore null protein 2-like domain-containing protein n=1 Tax=Caenorhabditis auriculariae TaxID=2777116 RepID=A0A8S1HST4_9PELO|nr:unnamed protein product [Caenorhabditis auriculariae]